MEPEGSLPHTKVPATCPYPEPDLSSPYPHTLIPEDPFEYYVCGGCGCGWVCGVWCVCVCGVCVCVGVCGYVCVCVVVGLWCVSVWCL